MFSQSETCISSIEQFETMNLPASPSTKTLLVLLSFAAALSLAGCAKRSRLSNHVATVAVASDQTASRTSNLRININTASARELETLPGIGQSLAARIVEHREKNGKFRRPEHLIMVRGISDKRFRALRDLIAID